jgi:hypothetical protein
MVTIETLVFPGEVRNARVPVAIWLHLDSECESRICYHLRTFPEKWNGFSGWSGKM